MSGTHIPQQMPPRGCLLAGPAGPPPQGPPHVHQGPASPVASTSWPQNLGRSRENTVSGPHATGGAHPGHRGGGAAMRGWLSARRGKEPESTLGPAATASWGLTHPCPSPPGPPSEWHPNRSRVSVASNGASENVPLCLSPITHVRHGTHSSAWRPPTPRHKHQGHEKNDSVPSPHPGSTTYVTVKP